MLACCFAPTLSKEASTSEADEERVKCGSGSSRTSGQEENAAGAPEAVAVVTAKANSVVKPQSLNTDFNIELGEERDVVTPLHRGRKQTRSLSTGSPQTISATCDLSSSQQGTSNERLHQLDPTAVNLMHSPARNAANGLLRVTAADILTGAINSTQAAGYRNPQSPWLSGYALPLLTTTAASPGAPQSDQTHPDHNNHHHSITTSVGSVQAPSPSSTGGGVTTPTSRPPLHPHIGPATTDKRTSFSSSSTFSSPSAPRHAAHTLHTTPLINNHSTTSPNKPTQSSSVTPQATKAVHLRGVSASHAHTSTPGHTSTPSPHPSNPYGFTNVLMRPRTAGSAGPHSASARQSGASPMCTGGHLRVPSKVGSASSRVALSGLLSRGSNMSASTDRSTRSITRQDFRPRWR